MKNDYIFGIPDPDLPIVIQLLLATTTIKGRLLSSRLMLKPFSGENIQSPVEMGPKNGGFGGNRGRNLRFWFLDPQKALPCAEPRRLTYFASKSVRASRL